MVKLPRIVAVMYREIRKRSHRMEDEGRFSGDLLQMARRVLTQEKCLSLSEVSNEQAKMLVWRLWHTGLVYPIGFSLTAQDVLPLAKPEVAWESEHLYRVEFEAVEEIEEEVSQTEVKLSERAQKALVFLADVAEEDGKIRRVYEGLKGFLGLSDQPVAAILKELKAAELVSKHGQSYNAYYQLEPAGYEAAGLTVTPVECLEAVVTGIVDTNLTSTLTMADIEAKLGVINGRIALREVDIHEAEQILADYQADRDKLAAARDEINRFLAGIKIALENADEVLK